MDSTARASAWADGGCLAANQTPEVVGTVDRGDLRVAWEPRGDWRSAPDRVASICSDLDLVHVVDVMREEPRDDEAVVYTRLHGLNEDRYDYDYDYDEEELDELADRLRTYAETHESVYCLLNTYEMTANARALRDRLAP